MQNKPNFTLHSILTESFIVLMIFSILYSKILLSISMIAFLILSIIRFSYTPQFNLSIRKDLRSNFLSFIKHPAYISLQLLFFMILISGINSENGVEWFHHLRLKLPYLIMPFVFFSFEARHKKNYYRYYYYFIILMSLSMIIVGANYLFLIEDLDQIIGRGQSIPTPIDHIKFSIMLAMSSVASIVLYWKKYYFKYNWELNILLFLSISSFVFLHVLAVRSGLACLYVAFFYLILSKIWKINKKYGLATLVVLLMMPFIAYKLVPTLQHKIDYMKYDYQMYKSGKGDNYSDSGRLYSYEVAIELFKQSPLVGTGIGDLKNACIREYKILFPNKNLKFKYPHNQFLFVLSGMGIIGFFLLISGVLLPLWYKKAYQDQLLTAFLLMLMVSFLVENTIERSYSIVYHLFFVLIAWNYKSVITADESGQAE